MTICNEYLYIMNNVYQFAEVGYKNEKTLETKNCHLIEINGSPVS